MSVTPLRIIFFGTPDFASASLEAIVAAGLSVVCVVTAADKPAGRGQKISESAVKKTALALKIPILQPPNLKAPDFIETMSNYQADLGVVIAFRMLPEVVWSMPRLGTINLHGSLLPNYRGAAPIHHAIINGEKESGVTTFFLKQEIDTGDVIFSESTPITEDDTAGTLHDKLMNIGAGLIVKTVKAIESGNYQEVPQPMNTELKMAPKIFKDFCEVNWSQDNQTVFNHIRGLSPYPTAFTFLNDKTLKIFKVEKENVTPTVNAGDYETDGKTFLKFASNNGYIKLLELQLEGKKRMLVDEFLRGVRL